MIYYGTAKEARFFPITGGTFNQYSLRLPPNCHFEYSRNLIQCSYKGESYLLALNPHGYLNLFPLDPKPDTRAAFAIINFAKGQATAVSSQDTPESGVNALIAAAGMPRSGVLC